MKTYKKNQVITVITFVVILMTTGLLHFVFPEKNFSEEEGRQLQHFPKLNYQDAKTGEQSKKIEDWFSDQFPFRPALIELGKGWRKIAFPNLNKGGAQYLTFSHDIAPDADDTDDDPDPIDVIDDDPDTPPDQSTDPADTTSDDPTTEKTEQPVAPPPIDGGEVRQPKSGLIIINDRAMERYYGSEKKLKAYGERLNRFADVLPAGTQLYSLVVPTAIELYAPEKYHSGYNSQVDCIKIINETLQSNVKPVNAYDKLLHNRDKYIYYRTDHHWTGLGAFYAYTAFCETAGWTHVPLDQMEHYKLEGTFLGTLYRVSKEATLKNNPDTTEGWKPVVDSYTATAWDKSDMKSSYKIRLNDERVRGGNSYLNFSGGDRALLKIETSHTSGRKILIIKDSFGNAFVPYLANHYDEIYVVDARYYVRSLKALVKENGITDVLVLNGMFGTAISKWLNGFDAIAK
ncbi:MAG TPA: hypothetical protein GX734_05845 [Clostridiaceae bacterium]|jgi:hypothetical protein|nr:hypothetical protein [Clostridiaceae bacterium]